MTKPRMALTGYHTNATCLSVVSGSSPWSQAEGGPAKWDFPLPVIVLTLWYANVSQPSHVYKWRLLGDKKLGVCRDERPPHTAVH